MAHGLQSMDSVVVACGLSCSVACGVFTDEGSHLCPLHWRADSYSVPPRESLENVLSHFFTDEETKALSNKNDLYTVSQVVILWSNTRSWIGSEIHTCLSFGETFPFFSCLNENGRFSLVLLIDVV